MTPPHDMPCADSVPHAVEGTQIRPPPGEEPIRPGWENGTIFERTVTYIKTSGVAPGDAGPASGTLWTGSGLPAGDSGAQPLTELLLPASKITRKN